MLKMNNNSRENVGISPSPKLTLVGLLSCGLTIVLSVVYATLSSLAVHARSHCDAGITSQSGPGSRFFLNTLLRLYFKQEDCSHSLILQLDITQEHTIFVLVCITLAVSIACFLSAVAFIAVLSSKRAVKFIEPLGYCYVATIVLSIATDLALAIHFGMDYNTFTHDMNNSSPGVSVNYVRDMYRLGALLLMIVSFKGGIVPVLNIVFITLIILYMLKFGQKIKSEQHSIHKVGLIEAFEHSIKKDDLWPSPFDSSFAPHRRSNISPMYMNDEETPRAQNREPSRLEYTDPSYDRAYSWNHSQPSVASRPFSYLADIKRQPPVENISPVREPQYPRDHWDAKAPPLPAPDYSPDPPRRLKSALKSSFL